METREQTKAARPLALVSGASSNIGAVFADRNDAARLIRPKGNPSVLSACD